MPMDGLTIKAVVHQLNNVLINARVDKITQPEDDEIFVFLRNNGENYKLLLSSNASYARLNITSISKSVPPTPSAFCMLLRKHLTGAKIRSFEQVGNDRIVIISFDCLNDFNEPVIKKLILEIMGKHSNIIFTDESNRIFDSIKRVNSLMSRLRLVQPGIQYISPQTQEKADPFSAESLITGNARLISDTYMGISRQAAEEIEYRLQISPKGFNEYLSLYKNEAYSPTVLTNNNGEPIDFFAVKQLRFLPEFQLDFPTISEAIDEFYTAKDKVQRLKERSHGLRVKLNNLLEKSQKKKAQQLEKLQECADMEKYRIWGELITANIYLVKKGAKSVTVQNYYDNMNPMEIPLDNTISAGANAQRYFKRYNKLKTASKLLNDQMRQTDEEIEYFSSLLDSIEKCETEQDIQEIRQELADQGYSTQSKDKKKPIESKPMHFISSSGIDIYVGKNNTQNDKLTLKFASADDLWLHVKDVHGSHVIIKHSSPDNKTIEEAAMLAAYYSKGRSSASVAVDATKRRFVKKPSGSLPGKVIYTNQTTYYITPDESIVNQIKKVQ